jgi:hypothetical protein
LDRKEKAMNERVAGGHSPWSRLQRILVVFGVLTLLLGGSAFGQPQWAADLRLTDNSYTSQTCENNGWALANDLTGRIHVLWCDWRPAGSVPQIYYKVYTPAAGWNYDTAVTNTGREELDPSAGVDSLGNLYVAWQGADQQNYQQIQYRKHDASLGWGSIMLVTSGSYRRFSPSLAVEGKDTVHIVWFGYDALSPTQRQIFYRTRTLAGWMAQETLTSGPCDPSYPSVAVDRSGNAHVAWWGKADPMSGIYHILYRRRTRSGGWGPVEQVTTSSAAKSAPSIAVDRNGDIHVVWHEGTAGLEQIYYGRKSGAFWDPPLPLTSSAYAKLHPSVGVDTSGRVHVAWWGKDAATPTVDQIFYRQRTAGGWQTQQQLTSESGLLRDRVSIACDREANPNVAWSDSRAGNFEIYYKGPDIKDAGVLTIRRPVGTVDSNSTWTPRVVFRNYGSGTEDIPVRMKIGSSYTDTRTVRVAANTTDSVDFTAWTAGARGSYAVICSTELNNDRNPANNRLVDTVRVQVRNVGVMMIQAPSGTVDSGVAVTPACSVSNHGTTAESYTVRMRIGSSATRTASVTSHAPGVNLYLTFPDWTPLPRGSLTVRCSTELGGDMAPGDDRQTGNVFVRVRDARAVAAYSPTGVVNYGTVVACSSRVRNSGNTDETFRVRHRIGGAAPYEYNESLQVALTAGRDSLLRFPNWPDWPADSVGSFLVKCKVVLAGDMNSANDSALNSVTVRSHDVGVVSILAPTSSTYDSGAVITPQVIVQNYGTSDETFLVKLRVDAGTFYADSKVCSLVVGQRDTLTFQDWNAVQRGLHTIKCTTALAGDGYRWNDFASRTPWIRVQDVAANQILAPAGMVDSGTTVTPQAQIWNKGTNNETFPISFRIGTTYNRQVTPTVNAGSTVNVTFPQVQLNGRGAVATVCTTALDGDRIADNNLLTGLCTLRVRDIALTEIVAPVESLDSGVAITPGAKVKSLGSQQETFSITMTIGPGYTNTQGQTLDPGDSALVVFADWTPVTRGLCAVRCTVALNGDQMPANDLRTGSVFVRVQDMAVTAILDPRGSIPESTVIEPCAVVANLGNLPETFRVRFRITNQGSSVYADSEDVTTPMPPGHRDTFGFDAWQATPEGDYYAFAVVSAPRDQNRANDSIRTSFLVMEVTTRDVSPDEIVQPSGHIYPGLITPRATVRNHGEANETFWTYFKIRRETALVFSDSAEAIGLGPGETDTLAFGNWSALPGNYAAQCSTALARDDNRANDVLITAFTVDSSAPGSWTEQAGVPPGAKNRRPKGGACLTVRPASEIFALKGNNTREFYLYHVGANVWETRESLPYAAEKKKRAGKGAALAYAADRDLVYALKGNNTTEFWAYDPLADSWVRKSDIPLGPLGKRLKGGSALVCVPTAGALYALKGSKTRELWRYDPDRDSWGERQSIPAGLSGKPVGDGGSLACDAAGTLYALKGNNLSEFYSYDPGEDSWYPRPSFPAGPNRKRPKAGAALASELVHSDQSLVFALKGNNTTEFYSYDVAHEYWLTQANIPVGTSGKRVKDGGALAFAAGRLYAIKGNNTYEFWAFDPSAVAEPPVPGSRFQVPGTMNQELRTIFSSALTIGPNPAHGYLMISNAGPERTGLRVYDVGGRLVLKQTVDPGARLRLEITALPAGVYLFAFEATGDMPRIRSRMNGRIRDRVPGQENRFVRKVVIEQ